LRNRGAGGGTATKYGGPLAVAGHI